MDKVLLVLRNARVVIPKSWNPNVSVDNFGITGNPSQVVMIEDSAASHPKLLFQNLGINGNPSQDKPLQKEVTPFEDNAPLSREECVSCGAAALGWDTQA
eukprot:1804175-Amphidinium_carterae.1